MESKTPNLAKSEEMSVVDEIESPVRDCDNLVESLCGLSSKNLDSDEILVNKKNPYSENLVFGISGEEIGGREGGTLEFFSILGEVDGFVIKNEIPLNGGGEIAGLMIEEEVAKFCKTLERNPVDDSVEFENQSTNFGEDDAEWTGDILVVHTLNEVTKLLKEIDLFFHQGADIVEDVNAGKSETSKECDKEGELETSVIVSKNEETSGVMSDKDDGDYKSDDEIGVEDLKDDEIGCSDPTEKGPFDGNVDGICEEDLLGNGIMPWGEEGSHFDSNVCPMRHSEKCEGNHGMIINKNDCYNRPGFDNREPGWGYLPPIVPKPEPCIVGAGLTNLGNTCFVNSIMQCFTHTVPFVEGILSLKHDSSSHGKDELCVLCAVRDQIEQSLANSGKVMTPSNIVNNLNHISLDFKRNQQQDAQELLACLFDKLDSNWCKYESNSENLLSPDSLVQQLFHGRLVSQIDCCNCGHQSCTYDPVIDLSLEINYVDNVESALKSFTKVETLEGTDKVKCNGCKKLVKAEKRLLLDDSPPIVVLHLKRFTSEGECVDKINRTVKYPLELDLQPFSNGAVHDNEDLKYELIGIVVHDGIFLNSGHYFCYIRASPDAWFRFDDSKALDQDAYILFYAKKGTPWFSSVLNKWKSRLEEKMSTSPKSVLESRERLSTSSFIEASLNGSDDAVKTDTISYTTPHAQSPQLM